MTRSQQNASKYVYGVVRARRGSRQRLRGLNDEPVKVVAHDGIGALASDVPDGPLEAGRDELMAHSRVLERALEKGVVLPMRFGMVMPTEEAIRQDLLGPYSDELEAQLDEMEGKVELNIKAIYEEQAILREVLVESPEIAALRRSLEGKPEDATYYERIRLGEQVATELARMRDADTARAMDLLEPLAESARAEEGGPISAFNLSFLVRRARQEEFTRSVRALRDETRERIELRYIGPLPPYSFADTGLEPGRSQWV